MRRCSSCGQDNPGGFRFCGACGSPLAEADAALGDTTALRHDRRAQGG